MGWQRGFKLPGWRRVGGGWKGVSKGDVGGLEGGVGVGVSAGFKILRLGTTLHSQKFSSRNSFGKSHT